MDGCGPRRRHWRGTVDCGRTVAIGGSASGKLQVRMDVYPGLTCFDVKAALAGLERGFGFAGSRQLRRGPMVAEVTAEP
jgi:hypothetical protein